MTEEKTVEERAQEMGWVPKEEWKGDPEKWRPAEKFVERGENIVPILKDRLAKLEEDFTITVKAQKAEIERVKRETAERAKADYDAKLAELNKKELKAVEEQDGELYSEVQNAKSKLKPPPEAPPPPNPVFEDWNSKNKWYGPDPELTEFANFLGQKLAPKGLPLDEFYKTIEKRVKDTFPQKFANPNREKETMVDSGSPGGTGGGKKTFSDLPATAKAAYERAAKRVKAAGGELKREDYVKEYFEE